MIVDFMPLIFSQPPSGIYSSDSPLEAFCIWIVESFLAPYIEISKKVVVCIDRKAFDNDYPLKSETHIKRGSRAKD